MRHRTRLAAAACSIVLALTAGMLSPAAEPGGYDYFVEGNPEDVVTPTRGLLAIQGGGTRRDLLSGAAAQPTWPAGAGCSTRRRTCSRYLRTASCERPLMTGRRNSPVKPVIPSLRDRVIETR